ncbi:hypothetical protein [Aeromonas dhakensis]|uniref:hypothetical protein n=1 Tax=Aeromonas dhakensis TaxID=196024 RepID=UPI00244129CC|nr:hypothetical protein [Aeromonas dhakensis]
MSTTVYFEGQLYPTDEKNGRSDKSKPSTEFEIFRSNYFGDDQIYLKLTSAEGQENIFHLTKSQASELSEGLESVVNYIGYDNT